MHLTSQMIVPTDIQVMWLAVKNQYEAMQTQFHLSWILHTSGKAQGLERKKHKTITLIKSSETRTNIFHKKRQLLMEQKKNWRESFLRMYHQNETTGDGVVGVVVQMSVSDVGISNTICVDFDLSLQLFLIFCFPIITDRT